MTTKVDVVDVVRHGEKLLIPEKMTLDRAITVLQRQKEYEEQLVTITKTFDVFPWDGALALYRVMMKRFGFVDAQITPGGFFTGPEPPAMINVKCGPGAKETVDVPWGKFKIPGVDGTLETGGMKNSRGQMVFRFNATVKRKFSDTIEAIASDCTEYLLSNSIYRGKAIKPAFKGSTIEDIDFVDLSRVKPEFLVFPDDIQEQIDTNLFTPVLHTEKVRKASIPLKRGVLLAGTFGTGKTLAAMVTAKYATDNGWTFIYLDDAETLEYSVDLAKFYQPCIVFAEDIDRVADIKDDEDNTILNILDGVLSKDCEIMTVLTTNYVDQISTAMFRPGRLDAVITITPPDSKAVQKLIRNYAGKHLSPDVDISDVGETLTGVIPAVVRECVERSKLYAITVNNENKLRELTSEALLAAAKGMRMQLDLLSRKKEEKLDLMEQILAKFGTVCDARLQALIEGAGN